LAGKARWRHGSVPKRLRNWDGIVPSVIAARSGNRNPRCGEDEGALQLNFKLKARVNRSDARTVRHALDQLPAKGSVRKTGDEFIVEAEMDGISAKELNRSLLSALRKVEKRTTLRAEWTSDDGTERFFDYVLKKKIKG
jgi:hypothetical protein